MSALPERKTPGVYVQHHEELVLPFAGVATAVPVFIGYTQFAPRHDRVFEADSLVRYEAQFGRGPHHRFTLSTDPDAATGFELSRHDRRLLLYDSVRLFYANGGQRCLILSVGSYDDPLTLDTLLGGLTRVADESGPTMLLIPDALALSRSEHGQLMRAMLEQCARLQDRVALLDVYGADSIAPDTNTNTNTDTDNTGDLGDLDDLDDLIDAFRVELGERGLSYGVAYFPALITTLYTTSDLSVGNIVDDDLPKLAAMLRTQNLTLNPPLGGAPSPRYLATEELIDELRSEHLRSLDSAELDTLHWRLAAALPLADALDRQMVDALASAPASAALAGVYSLVDRSSGVWHAPANVTLSAVEGLSYEVDDSQQAALNLPVDGKSIAAIRSQRGRGQVVWGARTLDGNSRDFRYVQVRRTLIYIEQSIKLAMQPYVFAANTPDTWSSVVTAISGFLDTLWARGALMGASPSEAYEVRCGLDDTMTALDVLDGYLVVQVWLQMIHPAEFIELSFRQRVQGITGEPA